MWTYSGVRPLYDDGASSASAATRDYVFSLDQDGAPLLNVFGGKITTYRKLAEHALEKLGEAMSIPGVNWTGGVAMPGGDFGVHEVDARIASLQASYPFLSQRWARRLIRAYGTEAKDVLGDAKSQADMGEAFGATLTEREMQWLMDREFVQSAEDAIWRRTKLGLRLDAAQVARLEAWVAGKMKEAEAA